MDQLSNLMLPEESQLDQGNYFQSLLAVTMERKLISEAEMNQLQYSLVGLLTKQTERFTSGESSSVTVEKAQSLLQGICYHISVYLKSVPVMEEKINLIKDEKLEVLHRKGMNEVSGLYHKAEEKLKRLQAISIPYDNQAFQDTLYHGLTEFFHDYEPEFAPQESAGTIDYPLCIEILGSSGVEYIMTYLTQLEEENHLVSRFPKEQIAALLQGFHRDYKELLINIYELVLTNALGVVLTGKKGFDLSIDAGDREWLQKKLQGRSREELGSRLAAAYEELKHILGYEELLPGYGQKCAHQLAERLYHNLALNTLEQIFITFPEKGATPITTGMGGVASEAFDSCSPEYNMSESIFYEEGNRMEDEELRELIEILNSLRSTSEKLHEIKRTVHSLEDLTELLPICFDNEEYEEVFQLLNDTELELLLHRMEEEENPYRRKEERAEWQNRLMDYYNGRITS
jgi:hypothetical protein